MSILIDGYNLMNATAIFGRGSKGTSLERSRVALLDFLAARLSAEEVAQTTIVFDSKQAPRGSPSEEFHEGLRVIYAKGYAEADDLIEELIKADHTPRQLLVVSSDHRLQRAAKRRRATFVDCDPWMVSLFARSESTEVPLVNEPSVSSTADLKTGWLREFGDIDVEKLAAEVDEEFPAPPVPPPVEKPPGKRKVPKREAPDMPRIEADESDDPLRSLGGLFPSDYGDALLAGGDIESANPFPPGYGDDLLEDLDP